MVHHPGNLFDYEDESPSALPIDREIPPWVAVPTTAGTGSEVGRSAVISDERTHVKKIVFSPRLLARAVFADPELTVGLPPAVTAATGMDALTHCIEAYLAKDYHPICDGIALEGLRLAARALPRAVESPQDLAARGDMLMASMMGAIAFQKGLGLTHSCAHALSTVADLHHGLANGVMIEHALRFNLETSAERFRVMAQTIGLPDPSGEAFLAWLTRLKSRVGIPARLRDTRVPREALERLPSLAFRDACHVNNPRPCQEEDFRRIYEAAW
jgi:alcohol dehydrogenase class IV